VAICRGEFSPTVLEAQAAEGHRRRPAQFRHVDVVANGQTGMLTKAEQ
jgi:hypothetical protein